MFSGPGPAAPHVKSAKLRALAVTSAQRWAAYPQIPTIAQAALPGYEAVTMTGIFAPANTPAATITRLNREFVLALNSAEMKETLADGVEAVGGSPERLAASIKSEIGRVGKLIKTVGIQGE
jgi:tripartite-type tricarboxylate transporter receptor subunit TctC